MPDDQARLDQVTKLALAVLLDVADNAASAPTSSPLLLKAILWLLYGRSNSDGGPYAEFWKTMTEEIGGPQAAYCRSSYAHTAWLGIVRTLGARPEPLGFEAALRAIIKEHRMKVAPAPRD